MAQSPSDRLSVAIAGAGVIGLSCAFELQSRGHDVTLFDPSDMQASAGWAAAGMIAPAYELIGQGAAPDAPFADLCFESAVLWKDFARRIRKAAGVPVGYSRNPTLALARTKAELKGLETLIEVAGRRGHASTLMTPARLALDSGLSRSILGGVSLGSDHQIDNRRLLAALREIVQRDGRPIIRASINDRDAFEALSGGPAFDAVIWARGAAERPVQMRVKGQALALHLFAGAPTQTIRFADKYIVPKPDRIVIGATSETVFSRAGVEIAATDALLADAISILPALANATIIERWAGFRPKGIRDHPVIGKLGDGEFVASAHYRNGVLLAPVTARMIADQVEGASLTACQRYFAPDAAAAATA